MSARMQRDDTTDTGLPLALATSSAVLGLRALMERYVDGDERAFTELYRALAPRIRTRLSRIVHEPALVDDLTQLTFLRAHQARDRFEPQPGSSPDRAVDVWYGAIARNVALDHLRHAYRRDQRHAKLLARGEVEGMGGASGAPADPEALELRREGVATVRRRVREAIEQLPPGQREVVELHKLRGLSMAEIADRLQVRPGALRVRGHRAYKTLAALLGASPDPATTC